ncbi:DUF2520 domain-containing protein [Pseudobdellovibrio exovorus]|uniref:DUF2520 domain-containing protein n=1 Tax=Pseudobdellovibrio exovorus JSS TaxID=1184267 RepID=M4VEM6_9BACT|nr:DUF2520 domain-containing protein [Pseudobdellovibrio exovorus]AGH96476.1 hypothetical protein A11Q_2260 [Pseudobdellovibrio exovorus JSS]
MTTISPVLLVGAGRLARHLQHWNTLIKTPLSLRQWDRSQSPDLLQHHLENVSTVWLAISDNAIIPFYENYLATKNLTAVHFSGALNDSRLLSAHPLMSFPQELLPNEVYPKIHFSISGFTDLQMALPNFENNYTVLPAEQKAFYHALCVLAGNFPQMIWSEVSAQMHHLQLPDAAVDLYIQQITNNYLRLKEQALTGPLVRRDHETISRNLHALHEQPKLQHIYETFRKEFTK